MIHLRRMRLRKLILTMTQKTFSQSQPLLFKVAALQPGFGDLMHLLERVTHMGAEHFLALGFVEPFGKAFWSGLVPVG